MLITGKLVSLFVPIAKQTYVLIEYLSEMTKKEKEEEEEKKTMGA